MDSYLEKWGRMLCKLLSPTGAYLEKHNWHHSIFDKVWEMICPTSYAKELNSLILITLLAAAARAGDINIGGHVEFENKESTDKEDWVYADFVFSWDQDLEILSPEENPDEWNDLVAHCPSPPDFILIVKGFDCQEEISEMPGGMKPVQLIINISSA